MPTFVKIVLIMVALLATIHAMAAESVKASNGIIYMSEPEEHTPPPGVAWLQKNERIIVTLGKCTEVQSSPPHFRVE